MDSAVEKDMRMCNAGAGMMDMMDRMMDKMNDISHKMDKLNNAFERTMDWLGDGVNKEAMGETYRKGKQEENKMQAKPMMHGISTTGVPANYTDSQDGADDTDGTESLDDPHDMITPPLCYICSCYIYLADANPRLTPGVYMDERKVADKHFWRDNAWPRYFRMSKQFPCTDSLAYSNAHIQSYYTRREISANSPARHSLPTVIGDTERFMFHGMRIWVSSALLRLITNYLHKPLFKIHRRTLPKTGVLDLLCIPDAGTYSKLTRPGPFPVAI